MAVEIGELETRVEAGPPPGPVPRRSASAADPRSVGTLLRRHLARRARLVAD